MCFFSPFSDNEHYQRMKSAATMTGRGRPLNLLQKPLTNRLLLQLELLQLECKKSWDEIPSFLPRVVDQESLQKFQGFNVKLEIEAARKLATDQSVHLLCITNSPILVKLILKYYSCTAIVP